MMKLQEMYDATPRQLQAALFMLCSQSVTIDLLMYTHIRKYQQYISDNIYIQVKLV